MHFMQEWAGTRWPIRCGALTAETNTDIDTLPNLAPRVQQQGPMILEIGADANMWCIGEIKAGSAGRPPAWEDERN